MRIKLLRRTATASVALIAAATLLLAVHGDGGAAARPGTVGSTDNHRLDRYDEFEDDGLAEDESDSAYDEAEDEPPLASFRVKGEILESGRRDARVEQRAQRIWSRFATLIPSEHRSMVSTFELLPRTYDGAYVRLTDDGSWALGVQDGIDDLDYVLIHEFGHLFTLHAGQIRPSTSARKCATYFFEGEGCARPTSYAARFTAQFWGPGTNRSKPKSFVTDYAATDPAEDMAESFAAFVLKKQPTGPSVAAAKVNFFWSDPVAVQVRAQILFNRNR